MTKPTPLSARPSGGWLGAEVAQQNICAPNALAGFGGLVVTSADADNAA